MSSAARLLPSGMGVFMGSTRQLQRAPIQRTQIGGGRAARIEARKGLSELLSLKKVGDHPPLKPGKVSPQLPVPPNIQRPPYAFSGRMPDWDDRPQMHDAAGIERMRAASSLAAAVLEMAGGLVRPGVTTDEIDRAVHAMIVESGAYPSPLNYGGFPKSVCTSINECICHGIPDSRPLAEGDILNIDVTVYLKGYHGDTSRMFYVGDVNPAARRLCEATKAGLDAAIKVCGPGVPFKEIGNAIQVVADKNKNNEPGVMQPGMTFTIEPMFSAGSARERYWSDGWTAVTTDGSLSAQWEHTLLITPSGVDVLTRWEPDS
eukprot:scaffold5.g834.t1